MTHNIISGDFRASNGHGMVCIRWEKGSWRIIERAIRRMMKREYNTPFVRRNDPTYYVHYDGGKVWDNGNYDRYTFDGKEFVLDGNGKLPAPKPKPLYFLPKGTVMSMWDGGSILDNNTKTSKTEHDMYGFIDKKRDKGIVSFRVISMGDFYCNIPRKALKLVRMRAEYDYDLGRFVLTKGTNAKARSEE